MDILEAIEQRRTIRKFSAPPTEEELERVLEAGAKAPSAGNRQAWFVIVINDPDIKDKMGDIKRDLNAAAAPDTEAARAGLKVQKDVFNDCTTLMFYTYAPEPEDEHRYDMGSVWLFVENICLAAVSEGLGTQIFAYWDEAEKEVDRLLGVPEKFKQVTGVNIGLPHPDHRPRPKTLKPKPEWLYREKWPSS